MDDEYELLPHEELEHLRKEIARLKQDPLQGSSEADDLKHSVDRLTQTLNKFISLMARTNDELLDQFQQTSFMEQFSKINENQEQIAKGIMTVANLLQPAQNAQIQPQQGFSPQSSPSPSAQSQMSLPQSSLYNQPNSSQQPNSLSESSSAFPSQATSQNFQTPQTPPQNPTRPPGLDSSMQQSTNASAQFPPSQNPNSSFSGQTPDQPGQTPDASQPSPQSSTKPPLPPPPPHKKGLFRFK